MSDDDEQQVEVVDYEGLEDDDEERPRRRGKATASAWPKMIGTIGDLDVALQDLGGDSLTFGHLVGLMERFNTIVRNKHSLDARSKYLFHPKLVDELKRVDGTYRMCLLQADKFKNTGFQAGVILTGVRVVDGKVELANGTFYNDAGEFGRDELGNMVIPFQLQGGVFLTSYFKQIERILDFLGQPDSHFDGMNANQVDWIVLFVGLFTNSKQMFGTPPGRIFTSITGDEHKRICVRFHIQKSKVIAWVNNFTGVYPIDLTAEEANRRAEEKRVINDIFGVKSPPMLGEPAARRQRTRRAEASRQPRAPVLRPVEVREFPAWSERYPGDMSNLALFKTKRVGVFKHPATVFGEDDRATKASDCVGLVLDALLHAQSYSFPISIKDLAEGLDLPSLCKLPLLFRKETGAPALTEDNAQVQSYKNYLLAVDKYVRSIASADGSKGIIMVTLALFKMVMIGSIETLMRRYKREFEALWSRIFEMPTTMIDMQDELSRNLYNVAFNSIFYVYLAMHKEAASRGWTNHTFSFKEEPTGGAPALVVHGDASMNKLDQYDLLRVSTDITAEMFRDKDLAKADQKYPKMHGRYSIRNVVRSYSRKMATIDEDPQTIILVRNNETSDGTSILYLQYPNGMWTHYFFKKESNQRADISYIPVSNSSSVDLYDFQEAVESVLTDATANDPGKDTQEIRKVLRALVPDLAVRLYRLLDKKTLWADDVDLSMVENLGNSLTMYQKVTTVAESLKADPIPALSKFTFVNSSLKLLMELSLYTDDDMPALTCVGINPGNLLTLHVNPAIHGACHICNTHALQVAFKAISASRATGMDAEVAEAAHTLVDGSQAAKRPKLASGPAAAGGSKA